MLRKIRGSTTPCPSSETSPQSFNLNNNNTNHQRNPSDEYNDNQQQGNNDTSYSLSSFSSSKMIISLKRMTLWISMSNKSKFIIAASICSVVLLMFILISNSGLDIIIMMSSNDDDNNYYAWSSREIERQEKSGGQDADKTLLLFDPSIVSSSHSKSKRINPCMDEYFYPTTTNRIINFKVDLPPKNKVLPPCLLRTDDREGFFLHPPRTHTQIFQVAGRIALVSLLRVYRNASVDFLTDARNPVICLLTILHTTACKPFQESLVGCAHRLGVNNFEKILPEKCTAGKFWKAFKLQQRKFDEKYFPKVKHDSNLWKSLPRGLFPESTVLWPPETKRALRPVENRTYAAFGPDAVCKDDDGGGGKTVVHPFGFANPEANVARTLPTYKVFDFMPILPSRHMAFKRGWHLTIGEEQILREFYSASYYAFTHRRGGFDCQRHHEQLAAGTVPYFVDLETANEYQVSGLPKKILLDVLDNVSTGVSSDIGKVIGGTNKFSTGTRKYFENSYVRPFTNVLHIKRPGKINISQFDLSYYQRTVEALFDFGKKHDTTSAFVSSMLRSAGHEDARRVLIFSRHEYDYMEMTIHQGLSELGIKSTMVASSEVRKYFYRERIDMREITEAERGKRLVNRAKGLYGGGFSFAGRGYNIDDDDYVMDKISELKSRIEKQEFDLVIYPFLYPCCYTQNFLLDHVRKSYSKDRVILVDHNDEGFMKKDKMYQYLSQNVGHVFAREIPDDVCGEKKKVMKRDSRCI